MQGDDFKTDKLLDAIVKGKLDTLATLNIDSNHSYSIKFKSGETFEGTPLQLAAYMGNLKAVKFLLENGADPEQVDIETGNTLLHYAVHNKDHHIVDIILSFIAKKKVMQLCEDLGIDLEKMGDINTKTQSASGFIAAALKNYYYTGHDQSLNPLDNSIEMPVMGKIQSQDLFELLNLVDIEKTVNNLKERIKMLNRYVDGFSNEEVKVDKEEYLILAKPVANLLKILQKIEGTPLIDEKMKLLAELIVSAEREENNKSSYTNVNNFFTAVPHLLILKDEIIKNNLDTPNKKGHTPYSLALKADDRNMRNKLYKLGANINTEQAESIKVKVNKLKKKNIDINLNHQELVIIDLNSTNTTGQYLKAKWENKHNKKCIYLTNKDLENQDLNPLTVNGNTKILVIAQGSAGNKLLQGNNKSYEDTYLAEKLSTLMGEKKDQFYITIRASSSASTENNNPKFDKGTYSFCASLQHELYKKYNKNIPVVGWVPLVVTDKNESLFSPKIKTMTASFDHPSKSVEKQFGSKVVYFQHEGHQLKVDVYLYKWKKSLIRLLEKIRKNLDNNDKRKSSLDGWIQDLNNSSTPISEVLGNIEKELKKPETPFKDYYFFKSGSTFQELSDLIEKGKLLYYDQYTTRFPVKTKIESKNNM